jgi:hypothetical protein
MEKQLVADRLEHLLTSEKFHQFYRRELAYYIEGDFADGTLEEIRNTKKVKDFLLEAAENFLK